MPFLHASIKWIMLLSGLLTCTMAYAAIAPGRAFLSTFGQDLPDSAAAEMVVRNWGVLITLMGVALIIGAFHAPVRRFALIIAGLSKIAFIGLALWVGQGFPGQQVAYALIVDSVMVAIFALYLVSSARRASVSA